LILVEDGVVMGISEITCPWRWKGSLPLATIGVLDDAV